MTPAVEKKIYEESLDFDTGDPRRNADLAAAYREGAEFLYSLLMPEAERCIHELKLQCEIRPYKEPCHCGPCQALESWAKFKAGDL